MYMDRGKEKTLVGYPYYKMKTTWALGMWGFSTIAKKKKNNNNN